MKIEVKIIDNDGNIKQCDVSKPLPIEVFHDIGSFTKSIFPHEPHRANDATFCLLKFIKKHLSNR